MKKILAIAMALALACVARAQDLVARYPDNYRSDNQYRVARAIDPLMGSLGSSTSAQLLKFERLDAVDAIGDRGQFALSSGVVVIPVRLDNGALDLGAKPAALIYEYSALDDIDCIEMIDFMANRYSLQEERIDPNDVVEAGEIDLPVPTGTLRITATPILCVFTLLPAE